MKADLAPPRSHAARKASGIQYAALPYRVTGERVEILLITSRRTQRWIVPKGWPVDRLTPSACAALEALEEAGVSGEVERRPIGRYRYLKHYKKRPSIPCVVDVFALRVIQQKKTWVENDERERRWCTAEEAAAAVAELELRQVILAFTARLRASVRDHL